MLRTTTIPFLLIFLIHVSLTKGISNQIIVSNRTGECISPIGGDREVARNHIEDGTPLIMMSCDEATGWDISPGSGSIVLNQKDTYAMDAGSIPGDHGRLQIWTSYPGSPHQTWHLYDNGTIALENSDECLDIGDDGGFILLPAKQEADKLGLQTYTCTTKNDNQAWYIKLKEARGPDYLAPPDGFLHSIPVGYITDDDADLHGQRIHPYNRNDICLTTENGQASIGTPVQVTYCFAKDNDEIQLQLWEISTSDNTIHLANDTSLCLDAGIDPSNNGGVKLRSCNNTPPQQWSQTKGQGVFETANNNSGPIKQPHYFTQAVLQTYQCYPESRPQTFHILA